MLDAAGNPAGTSEDVRLKIKAYDSVDWQTRKNMLLTAGLLNVFDT